MTKTIEERFWAKVNKNTSTGCWEWTAALTNKGYGIFKSAIAGNKAHRQSALLAGMNINGKFVCHSCDNPKCVNPSHLFVGTNQDNIDDKVSKNRQHRPEFQHKKRKLTKDDVINIRTIHKNISQESLAAEYNVTKTVIWQILNNKTYRDITC
jgi:hypothetical protein